VALPSARPTRRPPGTHPPGTHAPDTRSPAPSPRDSRSPGTARLRRSQRRAAALLIVPFFVLFALVMVAPIGYAVWMSLFQEQSSGLGFGGTERVFAGLDNYTAALGDAGFRSSFGHIALYCAPTSL
jgi:multiple sugar transport system permease protein